MNAYVCVCIRIFTNTCIHIYTTYMCTYTHTWQAYMYEPRIMCMFAWCVYVCMCIDTSAQLQVIVVCPGTRIHAYTMRLNIVKYRHTYIYTHFHTHTHTHTHIYIYMHHLGRVQRAYICTCIYKCMDSRLILPSKLHLAEK